MSNTGRHRALLYAENNEGLMNQLITPSIANGILAVHFAHSVAKKVSPINDQGELRNSVGTIITTSIAITERQQALALIRFLRILSRQKIFVHIS